MVVAVLDELLMVKSQVLTLFLFSQSKGAKEKIVSRIIVSRCEVDLKKVCSEYKNNFGQSLQQTITVSNLLLINCKTFSCSCCFFLIFFPPLYRNIPKETTRRLCSASVDQNSKNIGQHWKVFQPLVLEISTYNCILLHKLRSTAVKKRTNFLRT